MRIYIIWFLGICLTPAWGMAQEKFELVEPVEKISGQANHSAFTDLIRFQDRWYCVFREGTGHAAGPGIIRVLSSEDGKQWHSVASLTKENVDLRDPHICVTPDNRLMINGGAAYPAKRNPLVDHYSFVSFSKDGKTWTEPQRVLNSWQWLWRVTWHKGIAYGVAYNHNPANGRRKYTGTLVQSKDGLHWTKLSDFTIPQTTEATIRFDGDTMYVLQRRDGSPNTAMIGSSESPYTKWDWKDVGFYFGGPNFIQDPNGNWWCTGRIIKGGAKTVVGTIDLAKGKITPLLTLPSGGDTSYPGMVWHDNALWISYYSSHEGRTSIYLAKVRPAK